MSAGYDGQGAWRLRWVVCAAALGAGAVQAQSLAAAWDLARTQEPTLQAARANFDAAVERTAQATAALLPQLTASYTTNRNHRVYEQDSPLSAGEVTEKFPTRNAQLNMTQPLWRPAATSGRRQAQAAAAQAGHQVTAAEQELMSKLVTAWLDWLGARDQAEQARRQLDATRQQVEVARRGVQLGASSEVQLAEAMAKREQAKADLETADAELDSRLAALEQLTGPLPEAARPRPLGAAQAQGVHRALQPLDWWLAQGESNNGNLRAAERALAAAQEEVRKQQAQHQPTLDLVASRTRSNQGSGTTPGQPGFRSTQDAVGLQLNVPLFAGGGTQAKVREAAALAQKAAFELDAARRQMVLQVRQAWAAARGADARAAAGRLAVESAEAALLQATQGEAKGLKSWLDVLVARQQLAAAQRDQMKGHYDRLSALARLRAAAGLLGEEFLAQVDAAVAVGGR